MLFREGEEADGAQAMGLTEARDYTEASYALLADLLDVILTFSDRGAPLPSVSGRFWLMLEKITRTPTFPSSVSALSSTSRRSKAATTSLPTSNPASSV